MGLVKLWWIEETDLTTGEKRRTHYGYMSRTDAEYHCQSFNNELPSRSTLEYQVSDHAS